jgi:hypothetical protein
MPTQEVIHIAKSHKPTHSPKLAKEYAFPPLTKKKRMKSTIAQQWLYGMVALLYVDNSE